MSAGAEARRQRQHREHDQQAAARKHARHGENRGHRQQGADGALAEVNDAPAEEQRPHQHTDVGEHPPLLALGIHQPHPGTADGEPKHDGGGGVGQQREGGAADGDDAEADEDVKGEGGGPAGGESTELLVLGLIDLAVFEELVQIQSDFHGSTPWQAGPGSHGFGYPGSGR